MTHDSNPQDDLDTLKLGAQSKMWLREIGVSKRAQIAELGVIEVYRRLKAAFPDRISLNMLWGLEVAMTGQKWNVIPDVVKADLIEQLKEAEGD